VILNIFRKQLTVGTIGFSGVASDFTVLSKIAERANSAGSSGLFQRSDLCTATLSHAITNLGIQLTTNSTRLSKLGPSSTPRTLKETEREMQNLILQKLSLTGWQIYNHVDICKWNETVKDWDYIDFIAPQSAGLAIRKKSFASGAERFVFQLSEVRAVGVAKMALKSEWHEPCSKRIAFYRR
jgi:hypothetical protein